MSDELATATRVVASKLGAPCAPIDVVARPRLIARLRAGLSRPLTLVRAPAGFGKTTLLASALGNLSWPVAWLALDRDDSHLPTFLHSLLAALQHAYPGACPTTRALLESSTLPSVGALAPILQDDLATLPDEVVLVLDEYHLVDDPEVHALLAALLRRAPASFHLVVATREAPPWRLARMRTAEALAELGPDDLRFTGDETQRFLTRATGGAVGGAVVAAIQARMAGWAAGLRLAAIALREGAAVPAPMEVLEERARQYVLQYLREEVVGQQPPPVQAFLQRTAILEEVCAPLADALLDEPEPTPSGVQVLADLEQAGLFVSATDEQGGWYRYHDLLRDALLQELYGHQSSAVVAALERRASEWFAARGRIPEAVRHALAGDDAARAAELVEARAPLLLDRGEWQVLEEWLRLLPVREIEQRPALLLAHAWVAHARYQLTCIPALLQAVEQALDRNALALSPERVDALHAEADGLWALIWLARGDSARAVSHAERAWAALPPSATHALGHAAHALGLASRLLGHPERFQALLASERGVVLEGQPGGLLRLQSTLAVIHLADGDLPRAEHASRRVAQLAGQWGFEQLEAWAHCVLGRICYLRDDLVGAEQQFTMVVDLRHKADAYALCASLQGLALTNLALGRSPTASQTMQYVLSLARDAWNVDDEVASAFEARLALMQGEVVGPRRWLHATWTTPRYQLAVAPEVPDLTRARVLLALGTDAALAEASRLLADLLTDYCARYDAPRMIEILAVQALAHQALGASEHALATLDRAVHLATPGGFVRPFVDLGPPLARLLLELQCDQHASEFVSRLLEAFAVRPPTHLPVVPTRDSVAGELIEPLTEREREVLGLLGSRLTNKEVASTLHISWQTVTKHTVNIYQKLQVADRREAVRRGQALGLIPPGDTGPAGEGGPFPLAPADAPAGEEQEWLVGPPA